MKKYCRFVDNRNGNLCEETENLKDADSLGVVDYQQLCPKHYKYIKRWLLKH